MAYGVKYQCEWTSPMREQREYLIEILEKDYTGEVLPLYPRGEVLTITQGQIDAGEFAPIKASQAELSLLCVDDGNPYAQLFTTDPLQFMLRVKRYYGIALNNVRPTIIEWQGYLTAGSYHQPYANPPYHVTLRAVDGIALLKDMLWLDSNGARYQGIASLEEIIGVIMEKISDMPVSYPWRIESIEALQQSNTLSIVGLDSLSLYASFGESVVDCYTLLEAILTSLQCQLFQSYGKWIIRPLTSIATAVRPSDISMEAAQVNNGQRIMPLYTDAVDDTGVSTSATLSLLPPLKTIRIERPTQGKAEDYSYILSPERWIKIYKCTGVRREVRNYLRIKSTGGANTGDRGVAYILDYVSERSPNTSLTISFDCYNLSKSVKKIRVGLFAYPSLRDPSESLFPSADNDYMLVRMPIAGWDPSASKWKDVSQGAYFWEPIGTQNPYPFDAFMQSVELPAAKSDVVFEHPAAETILGKGEILLQARNLDISVGSEMRFMIIVAGEYLKQLPPVELRNPSITAELALNIAEDVRPSEAIVNPKGIGEVSFKQHFADQWVRPIDFKAPLIQLGSGKVVTGFVVPSQRALAADVAISNARLLRGNICHQIEGDIYTKTMIDLDAMWRDREGRIYYTNYIRRHLKRGLYNVQLREFPSMNVRPTAVVSSVGTIKDIVGLDTSAYWTDRDNNLWRYDCMVGEVTKVLSATSAIYINAGQGCVSVICNNESVYTLYAYDTHGQLLSTVDDFSEVANVGVTSSLLGSLVLAARYDANINTWSIVGSVDSVTYRTILTREGEVIKSDIITIGNATAVDYFRLIPGGFAYSSVASQVYGYYYLFAQDITSSIGENKRILAATEKLVVIDDMTVGIIGVHARTDSMMSYGEPLYTVSRSTARLVDVNNALVLFRKRSGGVDITGAMVYDARTGTVEEMPGTMSSSRAQLWLSGSYVYAALKAGDVYRVTNKNIILNGVL